MKTSLLLVTTCLSFAVAQQSKQANITMPEWLVGSWRLDQGIRTGEEHWLPLRNGRMAGKSLVRKNGTVTLQETMFIEKDSTGSVFFRALTGGQPLVTFKMMIGTKTKVVFENLKHDFPQRIIYEFVAPDSLQARIEGEIKGKFQSVHFPYRKVLVNAD